MDIGSILIGGAVTLAGTVFVQLRIVPAAQRRTRRLERWENDIAELAALVEEELPRVLFEYRHAQYACRLTKSLRGDEKYDQAKVENLLSTDKSNEREQDQAVGRDMARLRRLADRVSRVNPGASYWRDLQQCRTMLSVSIFLTEDSRSHGYTLDDDMEWDAAWTKVDKRQKDLLSKVEEVAGPMVPPQQPALPRLRERVPKAAQSSNPHDLFAGP